jgi:hypothetical protein
MEFKLIIAGGRDFADYDLLASTVNAMSQTVLADKHISIVSGMARGADALGYMFAHKNNVQVYEYPANWNKYGKQAGFRRNTEMGRFADGLLAFWDGKSKGTQHMLQYMTDIKKPIYLVKY